jgi:L-lactate dehydrogenase complex protein LldF
VSGFRERSAEFIASSDGDTGFASIMRQLVADAHAMRARGASDAMHRAAAARAYAVEHLDELHAVARAQFERRGVGYHVARTSEEAVATVKRLLGDARRVPKSKTMVGEEVGLTHALRDAGIDVLETDIGEYIVDIEGRGPSHITAPAIHLNRTRIQEWLNRSGASLPDDDPTRLSQYVRDVVGEFFRDCDAAITGANAVIAGSGRIVSVENEGNVSLGVSHPRKHIVITGMEKLVADEAGALAILEVLAPSATAQPLTSFTHFVADPLPGQERHIVFVDNGRSRIRADARYREALKCIRCGACMNTCPVYRAGGGLAYGSPYMGPIGAVVSPMLWEDGRASDLPFASSLCGACTEICPVGIPLHRMLLDLRADAVDEGRAGGRLERAGWGAWSTAFAGARRGRAAEFLGWAATNVVRRVPGGDALRRRANVPVADSHGNELPGARPVGGEVGMEPGVTVETPKDLVELFRQRAAALGVEVVEDMPEKPGDRRLSATAAVASTGSVLLTGVATLRRPLLAATRVVVDVEEATIVEYPHQLEPYLGDGEALILTGASRTADIEKQIVRGIHGSEELVVVLRDRAPGAER